MSMRPEDKKNHEASECGYTDMDQPNEWSTERNQRNNNSRVGTSPEIIIIDHSSIFGAVRMPMD